MKKLAIIGAGSGGLQTLSHFLTYLENWEVSLIYDPSTPIVGVGESTNPGFINTLELGTNTCVYDIIRNNELDATIKLGTLYREWRDNEFINPLLTGTLAIHMNTFKLKSFLLPLLKNKWKEKFKIIEGRVVDVKDCQDYVAVNVEDEEHKFDYIINCTGFPKDYTDYNVFDMPVNHCLVHNVNTPADWKYTLHQATPDGWMFGIPLTSRTSYGYLFNDNITTKEQALENFSKTIDVPINDLNNIEYKFKSYIIKKIANNRICYNGNLAVFFEPMFANSLHLYMLNSRCLFDYFNGSMDENRCNDHFNNDAMNVHDLICYHYHGGSKFDTAFWQNAKRYSIERLKNSQKFKDTVALMNKQDADNFYQHVDWVYPTIGLYNLDKNLKYNYWS